MDECKALEGGETVFPNTETPKSRNETLFSQCGNKGKAVKPNKGDAILFWSMKVGGELDGGSSHAGRGLHSFTFLLNVSTFCGMWGDCWGGLGGV